MLCTSDIVSEIFGLDMIKANDDSIIQKVILVSTNVDVSELYDQILAKIEGTAFDYFSVVTAKDDNNANLDIALPIEFVISITLNGLPPHELTLKVKTIMRLLRNMNSDGC